MSDMGARIVNRRKCEVNPPQAAQEDSSLACLFGAPRRRVLEHLPTEPLVGRADPDSRVHGTHLFRNLIRDMHRREE
jgi:hypothetical protein